MVRRVSAGVAGGTGSEVWVLRRRVSGSTFPSRIWVGCGGGGPLLQRLQDTCGRG